MAQRKTKVKLVAGRVDPALARALHAVLARRGWTVQQWLRLMVQATIRAAGQHDRHDAAG